MFRFRCALIPWRCLEKSFYVEKGKTTMALLSTNINSGHCQGIIAGEVYSPKPGVALVTLKVKGGKSDPETKKRPLYFIQFIAYDELAEELIEKGEEGRILYLHFYLSTNNRKDENGVSAFYYNRIADRAVFGKVIGDEPVNVPYLNSGVLQGEFAGIRRVYDGRNQWSLLVRDTVRHESGGELKRVHRFVIDSDELKFRAGRRKNGDPVLVEYRMESHKEVKDGKTEHFVDYVLTSIV